MKNKQLLLFSDYDKLSNQIHRNYLNVPGLIYYESFLAPSEQIICLETLDCHTWLGDLKRRVQHYGYRYDYKARRVDPSMYVGPLPPFAAKIAEKLVLTGLVSKKPDQLIINEYRPGQGIAPHVDCEPCFQDEIATISLGSVYEMELSEISTGITKKVDLELGSCLVFTGCSRYAWKHGIRPRLTDRGRKRARRVSLTFRKVILDERNRKEVDG
ncbi:2OG-Fe(II) oxygenase superfamily protein [Gimesia alba]|uniref:2OG-Fe(II) oxygenase superfamily protein n=1 Tax=Gimesia alba TaxID=2527973 RepID=A0A517RNJ2_9PLAN|nr:alpha-ketoglutarate-dependent dioxygenase AlkB [Gimesia alba]QDT45438.1 2OG-Fe(II) oxygenase superfamily protein [Gimesia alba]